MEKLFEVVESIQGPYSRFEILQYKELQLPNHFYAQKSGIRLKQIRIKLNNGTIMMEAGALHFMKGNISAENPLGGASIFKKLASSVLTKEKAFKPIYTGQGEIYLEPSFGHYLLYQLKDEEIIVDKGMFYCCDSTVKVGVAAQKNISSTAKGGEGFFQTKLSGTGIAVLTSPVPKDEIIKFQLENERLQVDGNFAILRSGNIQFTVTKSTKSIIGSMTSGEGLLQTFTGTGQVWIAPTQYLYQQPTVPSQKE